MKMTKRIFALLVCAVMLATSCIFVNAGANDKATVTVGNTVNINEDVSYTNLTIVSGQNGNTVTAVSMEFDPADGYFPMAFVKNAGSVGLLNRQYESATTKYGFDVIGAINGSFFGMDSGTLVGLLITNGKVSCAHAGYTDSVVAFGTDGSMNIVKSKLDYKLFINGTEIKNGLYYINKTHGKNGGWTNNFYYYDTSCGTITDTYDTNPGYTVICEKLDNTDLIVGGTLKGKVLEVKADSSYVKFEETDGIISNKFAIFVKSTSPNAQYVKDLKAGDSINIGVSETYEESREIMENANSVITNVGWLVKDGVDRTRIDSTIGTHSVTLEARWTAFGTKPDGSYIFFTSEGASTGSKGSITLRDVADYMISQGCTNVIRMDGGGSSAMYVKDTGNGSAGYVQSSSRAIADCILIVKKSSAVDEDLNAALQAKIDEATASLESNPNEAIAEIVADAKALLASDAPVSGDVRAMLSVLSTALSGKDQLSVAIAKATGISYKDYSEAVLSAIRENYEKAVELLGAEDASLTEIKEVTEKLNSLLSLTGDSTLVLSQGASYVASATERPDSYADDGIKLTDGSKGNLDAGTSSYSGWGKNYKAEVVVDLGAPKAANTFTVYAAKYDSWGIPQPASIEVFVSDDNSTFTSVGTATAVDAGDGNGGAKLFTYTVSLEKAVTAQYVKFYVVHGGNHVWFDEVEVAMTEKAVTDAIYVNGFNTSITSGMCYIFTPTISSDSTVTGDNANHKWTTNVVLEKTDVEGEYVVIKKFKGNGASTPSVKLEANQIMIAAHNWEETVPGSQANEALLATAQVGQTIKFYGIDIDNCTAGVGAYAKIVIPEEPEYVLGDVNGKDGIEKYDYIAVKRAVMGTLTLDETQQKAADVNKKDGVEKYDYILIKRHVMGTYTIEG